MATSGSVKSGTAGSGGKSYFLVEWSIPKNGQSIPNNTTTISWTLKVVAGNYWYSNAIRIDYVKINGTTVKGSETYSNISSTTKTLASGTLTIPHNSDGTKTFSISLSGWFYDYDTKTGSGSFTLPAIPRYATVTQTLSSKTETSVTMKWTSDSTIDYIWYSSNNGSNWTGINVTDGKSGSYTISGLSANTTYKIKTRVRRKDSQLTTDSSALSVTTYAYPYANSMPDFTIGEKLTIGLFNPLGRSVEVYIIGNDNTERLVGTYSGTTVSGFIVESWINWWYASIPNTNSGIYKVKVTYGSQITTKTGGTYSINVIECFPSISSVAYEDTNSTVTAITENNQNIVRNHSTVRYIASGLTAQKSATVASCKVTVNGNNYNLTLSGSSASGGNAVINSGTDVEAVFTVTDSRGLTATKKLTIHMLDWQLPTAIISIQRRNNYYSETDINVDADYSYVDGKNSISIAYKAKIQGTSSWTVTGTLQDNVTDMVTIDNTYAWDFQITLTDRFGGTVTYNVSVARGMPIAFFDRIKESVGINCFPNDNRSLEVNGFNLSRNIMTRALGANVTNLVESTYTKVPLDLTNVVGSKLTAMDDGGIKIGSGVSKILVSGRASIQGSSQSGRRHLRIMKNSYTNNNTIAWSQDDLGASVTEDIVITPTLGDVQEGDIIYLWYYVPNTADTLGGNAYGARTSMTVEVVG